MLDTLSKFIGTALLKLGDFAQYVSDNELEAVAYDRLAFYLEDLRESDQNQRLKSLDFTLADAVNEVNVKDLAKDIHTVAWVEVRLDRNQTRQIWQFVPTVNLDVIPEYQQRGEMVCAFWGGNVDDLKIVFSYYGDSYISAHRLKYDANIVLPSVLNDTVKLPNNLGNVITHDIVAEIIPHAQLRMLDMLKDDALLPQKIEILDSIRGDAVTRKTEWAEKWNNFKQNAHRSQRGMKKPRYMQKIGL